ncbi:hypothetical protein WA588_000683 [Blastocystis sp. NMH]
MNHSDFDSRRDRKNERAKGEKEEVAREKQSEGKQNKNSQRKRSPSYDSYSYSYSDYSYSSRSPSPVKKPIRHTSKPIQQKRDDRSHLPIRERLPLPDLGAMKRMMSNLHKSNQNAEKKEKESCRRKLEELERKLGYR